MILDATIVQKILTLQHAYPGDNTEQLAEKATHYFSHREVSARVASLMKHWMSFENCDTLDQIFPLFMFYATETSQDRIRFVFDKREPEIIKLWKILCSRLDMPSHLKKWGSSSCKVYREIDHIPVLDLTGIQQGKAPIPIALGIVAGFACEHLCTRMAGDSMYFKFPNKLSPDVLESIAQKVIDSLKEEFRIADTKAKYTDRFTLVKI